jgi:predicted RNA-binding protein YlqC (UPF0109 family)
MPDVMARPTVTELLTHLVASLVDFPEALTVTAEESDGCTTCTITADPRDTGRVIGKQGRTARALRTLLVARGMKEGHGYSLNIAEHPTQGT